MTRAELEALPENGLSFGYRDGTTSDGRPCRIAFTASEPKVLWFGPESVTFVDAEGRHWQTGSADGVTYKQRVTVAPFPIAP